jgi:VWFA-related protein
MLSFVGLMWAQTEPIFRAGVSLVHVDIAVYSKDGKIVQGLNKSNFRVFDQEQEQNILVFSVGEVPLDLILLFDVSGSMHNQVQKVAAAAGQALQELRSGDRVSVMAFNSKPFMATPFTSDRQSIELDVQSVLRQSFRGGTEIQRAVDAAGKRLFEEARTTGRRRAILIITDNLGRATMRESRVIEDLWEADATLCGLLVNRGRFSSRRWHVPGGMENIAEKTGGETIHAENPAADFRELIRRLRSRYDLYYATPEARPGSYRDLRVEFSADAQQLIPGSHSYSRRGYRVPLDR